MPTLPGGETNILTSLSRFASSGASARIEDFDWGALVASSMIGKETERQLVQLNRFKHIRDDLRMWLEQMGLASDHLQESAFYAVIATPPETTRQEQAMVLGQLIAWIYEVDDFMDIDAPDRLRAIADAEAARHLDNALARIFAPIHGILDRREFQRLHPSATRSGRHAQAEFPREPALIRSLEELFARLPITWEHIVPPGSRSSRYRERLVASQLIACVRGMRHEFWWNRRLANMEVKAPEESGAVGPLPSLSEYENTGADSIGMCVGSAWATTCERAPGWAWRNAAKVVDRSKRIIRLANDAYTYEADAANGKMSAVTLQLQALGAPLCGPDTRQVPQARERVEHRLKTQLRAFAHASKRLPASMQSYYLRHVVAFASAVYGAPAMG
jgi:Terpene synthase family 2, C-terminal metal binding